ncbi:MAG: DNA polymerase III subunit delta [Burkholderiales bacterium]|nr:DNA polymerase III subunit delta [Burkholderiales bacterium]
MRVSTEQLAQHLARDLKPVYTVFGDETLLAIEAADRVRASARRQGYGEREVLTVESGFQWSELAFAGNSRSLFSQRRLLELRSPGGKPGTEGGAALAAWCEALPPDTVTLIQLPGIDWRSQKSAWFEALDRAGVLIEAKVVSRKALPEWLAGRLKAQGQEAERETLDFVAERVEGNLLAAWQEIQKLALLFPAGAIGHDEVRGAVLDVARFDVDDIGAALLEGDPGRIARILDGLRAEGVAVLLVLWAIAEELRAIGRVLAGLAEGRTPPRLWQDAKVYGAPRQALMDRHVRRFTREQVEAALSHAARADRMAKGLLRGDVWNELLRLALRLASGAPGRPGTPAPARNRAAAAPVARTGLF